MRADLQKVKRYFSHFDYEPTFDELYTFFPVKISKKKLGDYGERMPKDTLGEYRRKVEIRNSKFETSLGKIRRVQNYVNFISKFPQIRLIGLSGSVAMLNAKKDDDVDLFIISSQKRLWTARFTVNVAAWLCGLKRDRQESKARDKVCLNLFFSESCLEISKKRRTEYMAHEVLQMVPILDVNKTYRKFLSVNDWIHSFFPNVSLNRYLPHNSSVVRCVSIRRDISNFAFFGDVLELILKKIQLKYMSKPKGDESIEEDQLWFHPRDYSRIVKSKV